MQFFEDFQIEYVLNSSFFKQLLMLIIITGATKGIGKGLLEEFVHLGHTVIGCGSSISSVSSLHSELPFTRQTVSVVNVTNAAAVDNWCSEIVSLYGIPDMLINNAGVMNTQQSFIDIPTDDFNHVINVNVLGAANCMRSFMKHMIRHPHNKVIVNLSSGWGRSTSPNVSAYCCSKYAIEGLSKSVAQEVPDGMCVVPFSPNIVDTEMLQKCFSETKSVIKPTTWAKKTAPFLLGLKSKDNGKSLKAPV
ncbi:hypothetical protein P9112_008855 [Eukaryota sp. TZLM1-RC]